MLLSSSVVVDRHPALRNPTRRISGFLGLTLTIAACTGPPPSGSDAMTNDSSDALAGADGTGRDGSVIQSQDVVHVDGAVIQPDVVHVDGAVTNVVITISPMTTLAPGATQTFTATVTGTTNTNVTWDAGGGSITTPGGLYTAPALGGGYVIRAVSAADPNASATAIVNVTGGQAGPEPFYDADDPYVQLMSPMPYATYFAPATIRMWAHAPDLGCDGVNNYSPEVDFYMGTMMVGSVQIGPNDPIDYYEVDVNGIPAGSYDLYVRSVMAAGTVESVHVPVTVIDVPPHSGPMMDLTSDWVLSGSTNLELIGTPTGRALLTSSNGSRITSADGWTGHLIIQNADVIGLGSMDTPGIEVTASGTSMIDIENSVFDRCGPPSLTANDQAGVTIIGNTFQPNTLTPVNDQPDYAGSHPSIDFAGNSSAAKLFQGNNVGVSFVRFDSSSHWLIGGDHDADGNVCSSAVLRAGMEIDSATDFTIRGNISYHRYPFGWSQGHNLDFEGTNSDALVEHNVFRGSSWMIESVPASFGTTFSSTTSMRRSSGTSMRPSRSITT